MDLATITGALSGVNTAFTLLKGAVGTSDRVKINDAVAAMYDRLLQVSAAAMALQDEKAALKDENAALKQEIADLKQRVLELTQLKIDAADYELKDLGAGAFVMMYKPVAETTQPPHWLCAKCFKRGEHTILQYAGRIGGPTGAQAKHECPACRTAVVAHYTRKPGAESPKGA